MKFTTYLAVFSLFATGSLAGTCPGKNPVPTTPSDPSEPPVSPVPEECCCLAYKGACTMNMERMFHIKLFYNRKQGISPEEFSRYWANDHAALTTPFLSRLGVVKYSQYHSTPEFRDQGRVDGAPQILEFDGAAEFWVPDLETFQRMGADPEYLNVVQPDEANFIDLESIRMIIGVDYIVLENQKAVAEHGRTFE